MPHAECFRGLDLTSRDGLKPRSKNLGLVCPGMERNREGRQGEWETVRRRAKDVLEKQLDAQRNEIHAEQEGEKDHDDWRDSAEEVHESPRRPGEHPVSGDASPSRGESNAHADGQNQGDVSESSPETSDEVRPVARPKSWIPDVELEHDRHDGDQEEAADDHLHDSSRVGEAEDGGCTRASHMLRRNSHLGRAPTRATGKGLRARRKPSQHGLGARSKNHLLRIVLYVPSCFMAASWALIFGTNPRGSPFATANP